MNGNDLSRQLGDLPEEMIAEAMAPARLVGRKYLAGRVLRIAACLAVIIGLAAAILWPGGNSKIITEPGILAVAVHAAEQSPFTVDSPETVVPFSHRWGWPVNWAVGWPITLAIKDTCDTSDNISFHVTVDAGGYYVGMNGGPSLYPGLLQTLPAQFTVPNNTTIFWDMTYDAASGQHVMYEGTVVYTNIIIYDGFHIVGYAVLQFNRLTYEELGGTYFDDYDRPPDGLTNTFQLEMLASVSFPKVNGEYQDVSLEYVNACIDKVIR